MINTIMGAIGLLLYPLFSVIFFIIDLLQGIFYGLAGVGKIHYDGTPILSEGGGDGGETSTGLIYYLLSSDLIKNLLISIVTLALFLLIIFTAMAFIKNAYAAKQKTWQEIVGNAFKGLANFVFIPVCCLLGVWLSNILLVAINGATSTGGATLLSRKLFICCAYDANIYRAKSEISATDAQDIQNLVNNWPLGKKTITNEHGQVMEVDNKVNYDSNHDRKDVEYYAAIVDQIYAESNINIRDYSVGDHYSLFGINYLILIVGGVFMLYVLVSLAYAMIKRMFILLMLFVISPAICAMYPIDDGSAVGNWKKEFIKYVLAAYGAIVGMNLFFSLLPIIYNIDIVSAAGMGTGNSFTNEIFHLLIMASGLFVVKEFMGTLSGWIGGDDALSTGSGLRSKAKGAVAKYATGTAKTVKGITGAFSQAKGAYDAAGGGASGVKAWMGNFTRNTIGGIEKTAGLGTFGSEMLNWRKDNRDAYSKGVSDESSRYSLRKNKALQSSFSKDAGDIVKNLDKLENNKKMAKAKLDHMDKNDNVDKNSELYLNAKVEADQANDDYNRAMRNAVKRGTTAGLSQQEIARLLSSHAENGGTKKGVEATAEMESKFKDAEKWYDAQTRAEQQSVENEKLIKAFQAIGTPMGSRSVVEDTMMERKEIKVLEEIRDLLGGSGSGNGMKFSEENLSKLALALNQVDVANGKMAQAQNQIFTNPHGSKEFQSQVHGLIAKGEELQVDKISGNGLNTKQVETSFAKIQDEATTYNSALADKKQAEQNAKVATEALVKELQQMAKGNNLAEKAVEEFAKAMKFTMKDFEEFSKKLKDILKK